MAVPPEILNDFDEYREIIPSDAKHNDFEVIIDKVFGNELLLCIIENVTIGNLSGLGTTHLRYKLKSDKALKNIIKEYMGIVKRMKRELKGISSFFSWYQRHESYFVTGVNENTPPTYALNHGWADKKKKKKPAAERYIKYPDEELSHEYIVQYLQRYVEMLREKEWFSNVPHFAIIVKPISVYDENSEKFIPLGNLYLLFGMSEPKEVSFFKSLVNDLMRIWFRTCGARVVRELAMANAESEQKQSSEHIPEFTERKHKDKLNKTQVHGNRNFKLIDLYRSLFDKPEGAVVVKNHLITYEHPVFDGLIQVICRASRIIMR